MLVFCVLAHTCYLWSVNCHSIKIKFISSFRVFLIFLVFSRTHLLKDFVVRESNSDSKQEINISTDCSVVDADCNGLSISCKNVLNSLIFESFKKALVGVLETKFKATKWIFLEKKSLWDDLWWNLFHKTLKTWIIKLQKREGWEYIRI